MSPERGMNGDIGTVRVTEVPGTGVISEGETVRAGTVSAGVRATSVVVRDGAGVSGVVTVKTRLRVFSIDGLLTVMV